MKAFIIRDKHDKLYMSLKTFSKKNGDWVGTGFIELNDEDVGNSEMIKFSDDAPTVVDIMFGNPDDREDTTENLSTQIVASDIPIITENKVHELMKMLADKSAKNLDFIKC